MADDASYVIRSGVGALERLELIARLCAPATLAFLERTGALRVAPGAGAGAGAGVGPGAGAGAGVAPGAGAGAGVAPGAGAGVGPGVGAGVGPGAGDGLRFLDVGCGIGDVAVRAAAAGATDAVGLDVNAEVVAGATARAAGLGSSARYVTGTFADLGTGDLADFDVVYARCVLSHLPDPAPAVTAMLRAARPGGLVLVEDVEVAAVWSSPVEPALVRHVEFYVAAARAIGARPDVGPELAGALRAAGAEAVDVDVVQPVLRDPADLRIHARTMEAIADPVLAHGLATADEIDAVVARLDAWADEPGVVATLPRFVQVAGRRPA